MIIWSGWGILVPVFAVVAFFLSVMVGTSLPLPQNLQMAVGFGLAGLLSGGATFFFARWRESKPGRTLIDEQSGERIEVRPSAGSFFFIPTRFWAFVLAALGLAGVALGLTG